MGQDAGLLLKCVQNLPICTSFQSYNEMSSLNSQKVRHVEAYLIVDTLTS